MNNISNKEVYIQQVGRLLEKRGTYNYLPRHTIALYYYFGKTPERAVMGILAQDRTE